MSSPFFIFLFFLFCETDDTTKAATQQNYKNKCVGDTRDTPPPPHEIRRSPTDIPSLTSAAAHRMEIPGYPVHGAGRKFHVYEHSLYLVLFPSLVSLSLSLCV